MSRCLRSKVSVAALTGALLTIGATSDRALAQGQGGRSVTLDVSERLSASRNRSLTPGGDNREVISTTSLGFALDSRTNVDRLGFTATTALRGTFGDNAEDFEFADPVLRFGYSRQGSGSDVSFAVETTSSDISYLRPYELVLNEEDGTIEVVSDFDDLTGTGTRRQSRLTASGNWGKQARLGFGATLNLRDLSYQNVTSDSLNDSQSLNASTSARFAITPILNAGASLSYGRTDRDGGTSTETRGYGLSLTARGSRGQVGADFGATQTDTGGHRYSLSGSWSESLASGGQLALSLGTAWTVSGDAALTARANFTKTLPTGQIGAQLRRGVTDNADGDEILSTAGLVNYTHRIDRLSQVGMNFSYTGSSNLSEDTDTRQTELSASYSRQLAQNWTAQIGASRTWRDDDGDTADSDSLFLQFGRSFSAPF